VIGISTRSVFDFTQYSDTRTLSVVFVQLAAMTSAEMAKIRFTHATRLAVRAAASSG
jgi:hypothetical protein